MTQPNESPILQMIFANDGELLTEYYNRAKEKDLTDDEEISLLSKWEYRIKLYYELCNGLMKVEIPHEAAIPKDDGTDRIVVVGGHMERFLCPIITDCINKLLPQLTHKSCKSYQKGLGTGVAVKECSNAVVKVKGNIVGGKYDFHHYFDTVLKKWVFYWFDKIEELIGMDKGTDPAINYLRKIYSNDKIIDINGNEIKRWSGIRQGNAFASFLANALLYDLDDYMSKHYDYYVRYSDDLIVITKDVEKATKDILRYVTKYGVELNMKKTEVLRKDRYFKFLGFSIKGSSITISKRRLHDFCIEIRKCCHFKHSYKQALHLVHKYLYNPYGEYSWATSILPVVNCTEDLQKMNAWVQDMLRGSMFNKHHRNQIGGLGYQLNLKYGVVDRGKGSTVRTSYNKSKDVPGYMSLVKMQKALMTNKAAYESLVRMM